MYSRTIMIGRLVADPESKSFDGGSQVANFRLAVDRPYANKDKEREADFFNITCWNKLAEIVTNNLQKGRLVAVEGHFENRSYDNADGIKVWVTELKADAVKFLDSRKDDNSTAPSAPSQDSLDDVPF